MNSLYFSLLSIVSVAEISEASVFLTTLEASNVSDGSARLNLAITATDTGWFNIGFEMGTVPGSLSEDFLGAPETLKAGWIFRNTGDEWWAFDNGIGNNPTLTYNGVDGTPAVESSGVYWVEGETVASIAISGLNAGTTYYYRGTYYYADSDIAGFGEEAAFTASDVSVIPEPSQFALIGGFAGLGLLIRRRRGGPENGAWR